MASSSYSPLLLLILAVGSLVSLISPAIAQTCKSQNPNSEISYESCMDLPELDSYLHYTYNASNSSLSVGFVATPHQSNNGWISWGINPTGTKMPGSQAFIAYKPNATAAPVVKTYNISGYSLDESAMKLSFDFWNLRAESLSRGRIAIFTTVKVPAGDDSVNHVWQMGGNVTNGRLGIHPMAPANLKSIGKLSFTADAPGSSPAPTTGGSTTPGQQPAGGTRNAGSLMTNVNIGVNFGVLLLLGLF